MRASAKADIVEFGRGKTEGENAALVLINRLIEPVAPLYHRAASYGGEDRAESGSEPRGDYKPDHGTTRIGP
jgi:hypothetical protein